MRIVALGIEMRDPFTRFGFAVVVMVAELENFVPGGKVDIAHGVDGEVHRKGGSLEERAELIRLAVAVGVFDQSHAVGFGALIARGAKVRVALDDQELAFARERGGDRMNDIRRARERLDSESRIARSGR